MSTPSADTHDRDASAIDDLDAYVATLNAAEHEDLSAAETAIDIAILLYRARERRGLSQSAAAERAGVEQEAVSRLERPHANIRLETLQRYLSALGYSLEINLVDEETGEAAARLVLPATSSVAK